MPRPFDRIGKEHLKRRAKIADPYVRMTSEPFWRAFGLSICWALLLAASGDAPTRAHASEWSSFDPLGIPYETRRQQLAKGNLVSNPSFEQDGMPVEGTTDPGMPGWETVGTRVEWILQENGAGADEVNSGRRAIKIHRPRAGELDPAEGVISGYIPVIPGNYDFTYAVRLEHVAGNRHRLGGRLGDAVTVRVFFFDAEKKPLDATAMNPAGGNLIDTSDKSYSFANYWSVDRFDWARVRARSYNYPFSEGDLPDGTCYVRLFLGLKGSGTMWLDDVSFRYSKWNFSARERLKPYLDRPLSRWERLIPAPKNIRPVREIAYFDCGRSEQPSPLIVLPDEPQPADRSAARLLEETLNAALCRMKTAAAAPGPRARVVAGDATAADVSDARLVFAIGRNRLSRQWMPDETLAEIGGQPQGYVIQPVDSGPCHVVFLVGKTALGNFYAAATAAQLLEEERCVYHSAAVIDTPDFLGRSYLLTPWQTPADIDRDLDGLERMSRLKLNKAYAGYENRTKAWYRPADVFQAGIAQIGRRCREAGTVSLGMMVNPYTHFEAGSATEALSDYARSTWTHGDDESLETIQAVFRLGLEAGAGTIMLLADDFVPHQGRNRKSYSLYAPEDQSRFINLQNAQAFVINRLKAWLDRDYPGTRFEFCPPWYANEFIDRSEGKAEIYLQELAAQIPPDVAVIWTGPTVRSLSVDLADLRRFRNLIGRWPMFWDNTLYARNLETTVYGGYTAHYPGKVRMCSLFEPLDADRPAGFHELNDGRHMYVNAAANSEVYRVKFATVADYEWNTSAYIPERSLWKALVAAFGPECAREILFFDEAYYGLYDVCMRMEREAGEPGKYGLAGAGWLERLEQSLLKLTRRLPAGHALGKELDAYRDRQKNRFEELIRKYSAPN
jgi:hypothetical protein